MNKNSAKRGGKQPLKTNPLPILAGLVVLAALAVTLIPRLQEQPDAGAAFLLPAGSDLTIQAAEIGTEASYFDYDAGGTVVEIFAVRAPGDSVRLALNTCQVCNGSPYAYFVQENDAFVCQNCKYRFASDDIGKQSGGCNPVPITGDLYTEQNGVITIPAAVLDANAARFENWKNF